MAVKVLVIEDSTQVRESVLMLLEHLGVVAAGAGDSEEALRVLPEFNPDVALVDLILPGELDGFQLIEKINELAPQVKIIVTSGDSKSETFFRALRSRGVAESLPKPISLDGLASAVAKVMGIAVEDLGEELIG